MRHAVSNGTPAVPAAVEQRIGIAWRDGAAATCARAVAEETAIAITYDRVTHAVMMASPADLEDFAVGFSLGEGVVEHTGQIERIMIEPSDLGIDLRMDLAAGCGRGYAERRRRMAGPVGCGLCGIESLAQAMRPVPAVGQGARLPAKAVVAAITALSQGQALNRQTHAVHAAGLWLPGAGMAALREDVGRHNALDKLAGALARQGIDGAAGMVVLTSRVSVEMVQKTARIGAQILAAVSAPTGLALRTAAAAGITLVAVARGDGFEVFTHPERIIMTRAHDVA
ncbi:MAG TPA: formate dehydrogenase accessory sulfurtransferase FdhD [Acetobacteraceae bacterium]|nr:formate dehydrogenase accessory sulfurtransferase FdhD [Acetobacteraceae bacterium]